MMQVRKKDQVEVIAGKELGKRGEVIRVLPKKGRVFVAKLNMVKRHSRPTQKNPKAEIVSKEGGLHLSNVRVVCPKCDKPVRLKTKKLEDGSRVRICGSCDETLGNV
jgi:large subunit ribosomal protein L24